MFILFEENKSLLTELAWAITVEKNPRTSKSLELLKKEGNRTLDLFAFFIFSNTKEKKIRFLKLGEKDEFGKSIDQYDVIDFFRKNGFQVFFVEYFLYHPNWTCEDIEKIETLPLNSEGLEQAYLIAEKNLKKIFSLAKGREAVVGDKNTWRNTGEIFFCSGPMRNKDGIYKDENLMIFFEKLLKISKHHPWIFDQLPFDRFIEKLISSGFSIDNIFDKFFCRIIKSGYIDTLCMFDGWDKSLGARRENEAGLDIGLKIITEKETILSETPKRAF